MHGHARACPTTCPPVRGRGRWARVACSRMHDPLPASAVHEGSLRRELGTLLGVAVTVNAMVGTGIFRLAPTVLGLAGSLGGALLVWVFGGVVSLCGALCMGELSAAMPRAGGIYEYLRRAYGPTLAFWYGWTR